MGPRKFGYDFSVSRKTVRTDPGRQEGSTESARLGEEYMFASATFFSAGNLLVVTSSWWYSETSIKRTPN